MIVSLSRDSSVCLKNGESIHFSQFYCKTKLIFPVKFKSLFIFKFQSFDEFFHYFQFSRQTKKFVYFQRFDEFFPPKLQFRNLFCFKTLGEIYRETENIEVNFCVLSRFGWYIPESFAEDNAAILDHWRAFTDPELTTLFAPTQSDLNFILPRLKDGNER